ncbi:MAG: hypothetical protein J6C56_00325 [Alistipes sp.]|nr:hypothetical protein [Alistipes sp.]
MKRIYALIILLLVGALAVDASAQSSKLYGKWTIEGESIHMFAAEDVTPTSGYLLFNDDGTGEIVINMNVMVALDDTYDANVATTTTSRFTWKYTSSVVVMELNSYISRFNDISFIPNDGAMNEHKSLILKVMNQSAEAEAMNYEPEEWLYVVSVVDKNHLQFVSAGEVIALERAKR